MNEKKPSEHTPETQDNLGVSPRHQPIDEPSPHNEDLDSDEPTQPKNLEQEIEVQIAEQFGEILGPEQTHLVAAKMATIVRQESFSGPLPHPRHIEHFENVLPGSADRIFKMAEKQQDHLIKMETDSLQASVNDAKRGMTWGGFLFGALIACALVSAVYTGSAAITTAFLGAAVIGGIGLFINGRTKQ